MGGKPNPGTAPDGRLKANKATPKKAGKKPAKQPAKKAPPFPPKPGK